MRLFLVMLLLFFATGSLFGHVQGLRPLDPDQQAEVAKALRAVPLPSSLESWLQAHVLRAAADPHAFLVVPVHLFAHMRGVYRTSRTGTLLRMTVLAVGSLIGILALVPASSSSAWSSWMAEPLPAAYGFSVDSDPDMENIFH